jgi:hypothetical protein
LWPQISLKDGAVKLTNHLCRVGIYLKKDDYFRAQGRKDGKFYYITAGEAFIGCSADADIAVAGPGIAEKHLKITVKDREMWLQNVDPSGQTTVSGNPLSAGPFHYKSGEIIQLGKAESLFVIEYFRADVDPDVEAEQIRGAARAEAEDLLASAQRQLQEKSRQVIAESHAGAETSRQRAKSEADSLLKQASEQARRLMGQHEEEGAKILDRAKAAASDLLGSAQNEVELLLKQAKTKSMGFLQEGENQKAKATQVIRELQEEIEKAKAEKERLASEVALSAKACDEAIQKKQIFLKQTEDVGADLSKSREKFEKFQSEMERSEGEWQKKIEILKGKGSDFEAQLVKSQILKEEAQKSAELLKTRSLDLEKQIKASTHKSNQLDAEIKATEESGAKAQKDLSELNLKYKDELAELRQKVDAEYDRQIKQQEIYFNGERERETAERDQRQKNVEQIESARLPKQIDLLYERLFQMISDRGRLYGVADLKANPDFKNDLKLLATRTLTEEFDLRRKGLLARAPKPSSKVRRSRSPSVGTYGSLVLLILLGIFLYSKYGSLGLAERNPAAALKTETNFQFLHTLGMDHGEK